MMPKHLTRALGAVLLVMIVFGCCVAPIRAQGPAEDGYEDNDSLLDATRLASVVTLPDLTIYPAADPDFWRVMAVPGPLSIRVLGTPGLALSLRLYGPTGEVVAQADSAVGAEVSLHYVVPQEGYYVFEVSSTGDVEGFYELRLSNVRPTATAWPTATATRTAVPTATPALTRTLLPTPTPTATPELGAPPDVAEPNYDFATAYRLAPGNTLDELNFNPGVAGAVDNDFFVMAVRAGVSYTCRTDALGVGLDTNLIIYPEASMQQVLVGNDDEDAAQGRINSRVTFTGARDGDVYLLVGYKSPPGLRRPGDATYDLSCQVVAPTPTPEPVAAGESGQLGRATQVSLELLSEPEAIGPTAVPLNPLSITVNVAYDQNDNQSVDVDEGVSGLSVRVIDTATNRELTHGYTDLTGSARFVVPTRDPVRVLIPYLSAAEDFRPGSPVQWTLLIPAANAPGLIP